MRNKFSIIVLFFLGICMSSCSDFFDREIPPPAYEEKVVMFSLLDPDINSVAVRLRKTSPIFGDHKEISQLDLTVNDAQVSIADGTTTTTINRMMGEDGLYVLTPFTIQAGKTYTITAVVEGQTITGTTTVPSTIIDPSGFSASFDTISFNDLGGGKSKTGFAEVRFRDIVGQQNFYFVEGTLNRQGFWNYVLNFGANSFTTTDEGKDGQELGPFVGQTYLNLDETLEDMTMEIGVAVCDEAMYRYYRYLNSIGEEGDFFVEPAITYSNVENGLGVVGSRISKHFSVDL